MNRMTLKGRRALVTGASSGLGADFARHLARAGASLVLVARREAELEALAKDLWSAYGAEVRVIALDLLQPDADAILQAQLEVEALPIDILINNAGFGVFGDHLELPWERERAMMRLDMEVLVALTKRFAAAMVSRKWGRILNVSSIGAFQPTPTYAVYSAAKSFVLSYSEAFSRELVGTGVSVTAICPGITATEFLKVSGQKATFYQRLVMMDSPTVTRIGVKAMLSGRRSIVPGVLNSLTAWSTRLMPRRLQTWMAYQVMRNA